MGVVCLIKQSFQVRAIAEQVFSFGRMAMRIQENDMNDQIAAIRARRRRRAASIATAIVAVVLVCGLLAGAWYLGRYQTRLENEHRSALTTLQYGRDRL